jgi:hypothetical protein
VATVVFLEHRHQARLGIHYMAYELARRWEAEGHRVLYHRGLEAAPAGDLAFLHHDLTVVPESYLEIARRYPRVLNGATADIRKSGYSECLLARGDSWPGPVIIKTDANHGGHVDDALRRMALDAGDPADIAKSTLMDHYYHCRSMREVPDGIWTQPGVIVEKFIPEADERGAYMRFWTFFGGEERSFRYRAPADVALIRFSDCIDREPIPVPDELRAMRARLGFDFGKFDYVKHDGRYYLLDANRTPGAPDAFANDPSVAASLDRLAGGLKGFLTSANSPHQ